MFVYIIIFFTGPSLLALAKSIYYLNGVKRIMLSTKSTKMSQRNLTIRYLKTDFAEAKKKKKQKQAFK